MSSNSASNLKSRLRVVPIDVWSTREKLCLASSVSKSGDQNWSSVSRPLRAFGEPNRPNDWFHQKYCAIQYQELLEKAETDTPKRKRSERGEETTQTIIVRNLTKQRIEELRQKTLMERDMILKVKQDLDLLKNKQMNEKRFEEICNEIKEKEIKEKEREIEHKKWLEEREVKIALMNRKGSLHNRQKATTAPPTPSTPISQPTVVSNQSIAETPVKPPLNELKVEVDSETVSAQTTTPNPTTNENKLTLALTSPTTSPLLTSLLQSPTPSTPTLLSPNKSGLSANTFNRQKPLTPVSSPITPVTRRPSIHSTPEKVNEVKAVDKSEATVSVANTVTPIISPTPTKSNDNNESEQQLSTESSKLSKLLETPNTTKPKTTTVSEIKQNETKAQIIQNKESEQPMETSDTNISSPTPQVIDIIDSPTKANESTKESEKAEEVLQKVDSIRTIDESIEQKTDSEVIEAKDENKETEKVSENREELNEKIAIKEEMIESIVDKEEEQKQSETIVKEEPMDSKTTATAEDTTQKTPSTRGNKRSRKTPSNPITITPTVTRRSQRVALKDLKSTNDDSTEVSDQSAANTPQTVNKKRGSVDDTTETSMSEESMDAKIVPTTPSVETVPNSPASVRTEDMENSKEYRTWKKAIMVNLRQISAHKHASLFSHPVTEAEAKGYEDIVHKAMDLNSIKKRVELGMIRTTAEYERDILLMFQNAIMFNNANHDVHKMAVDMQRDTIKTIEDFIETQKHDNHSNESKLRARDRRSNVSTVSPLITENEISGRRKSRGASTDTDSNASGLTKSVTKKKKN